MLDRMDRTNTEALLHVLRLGHPSTPLFPQLRQIFIQVYHFPLHRDILEGLATSGIRELEINFFQDVHGFQPENPSSFNRSAVELLRLAQSSSLRRLRCRAASPMLGHLLALSRELSTIISRQPQLVELELVNFNGVFMGPYAAASLLQNLSRISFLPPSSLFPTGDPIETNLPNCPFPMIEELEIAITADHTSTFLSSISSSRLRLLDILFQPSGQPSSRRNLVPGVLHGVPRFTDLTMISLHFVDNTARWVDLNPLLSCPKLVTVELEGPRLSDVVGNQEIELIAQSWIDLQQLLVRDTSRYSLSMGRNTTNVAVKAPLATLEGLYPFAAHCPRMRELEISVDASPIDHERQAGNLITLNRHTIQNLRLPCSFVGDDVDGVAEYISTMWPDLRLQDDHDDPYQGSRNKITACMGERWARIWDRIEVLGHIREFVL